MSKGALKTLSAANNVRQTVTKARTGTLGAPLIKFENTAARPKATLAKDISIKPKEEDDDWGDAWN